MDPILYLADSSELDPYDLDDLMIAEAEREAGLL